MEKAVEILVARLASRRSTQSTIPTGFGQERIQPGTILRVEFHDQDGSAQPKEMLVLDFNGANQMAIAVEVERNRSSNSPVRIPIGITGTLQPASALVHRVRSIDLGARTFTITGATQGHSLETVGRALLTEIDH